MLIRFEIIGRAPLVSTPRVAGSSPAGIARENRYISEGFSDFGAEKSAPATRTDADQNGVLRTVRDSKSRRKSRIRSAWRNAGAPAVLLLFALAVMGIAIWLAPRCTAESGGTAIADRLLIEGCAR